MKVKVVGQSINQIAADAWVVGCYAGDSLTAVDGIIGEELRRLFDLEEFGGKPSETVVFYPAGQAAPKVVVVGLGAKDELTLEKVRQAAGTAYRVAAKGKVNSIATEVLGAASELCAVAATQATVEGALLAGYRYEAKGVKGLEKPLPELLTVAAAEALEKAEKGAARGTATACATNFARTLVNTPANAMTPTIMAERAEALAKDSGLEYEVLERADMEKLGMGSLLGVARGSAEPPKMIVLRYNGNPGGETVALVGKGITFDSGGISIKPSAGMEAMKGDMAGAAAVMGAMGAIGKLKPAVNVLGIMACTENLPSGTALKPGDVIEAMTGQTIEIISTDAEGRLVLADAVAYAESLGANRIVDVATLTGAIGVALGNVYAGIVANNDALVADVIKAGEETGERYWQMPTHDDYRELYKSDVATMRNGGVRGGGAITGGMIIGEFVKEAAWAHLDIAAMARSEVAKGYGVKGGSGFATRTLIRLVENLE